MKKTEIKSMPDLVLYARKRAQLSAYRNDPIAWAYWRTTAKWADECAISFRNPHDWRFAITQLMADLDRPIRIGDWGLAARKYSAVKWFVTLLRNNGHRISTRGFLRWMKRLERPQKKLA